jgi:hypothetical protein
MTASYPNNVKVWSPTDAGFEYPEDLKTIVFARHVTTLYEEVTAVQRELGAGGLKTGVVDGATAYNAGDGVVHTSLKQRLDNMEQGVLAANKRRVSTVGGSTILPSGTSVVGLTVTAASGQTANLVEFKNSSNTVRTSVGADGLLAGVIDGGSA